MDLYPNILRTKHPYRKALFDDPDYFWRWHPDFWPEPYRSQRRRATAKDLAEVEARMATWCDDVGTVLASIAPSAGQLPRGNGAERKTSARVHVPPAVRRRMQRRPRRGR